MFTFFYRVIKYAKQNFLRNGLLSTATIGVMTLALLVFLNLIVFGHITRAALTSIQDKIDISVYFKTNSPEDEILRIKRSLETLGEVQAVEYISRSAALEIFKERHKDDATISQALEEVSENPLPASLNIKAYNPREYAIIASYLNNESLTNIIEKVSFTQNQVVIERLASIIDTVRSGGLILAILLSFIAGLVVFNTIRLAIYSNREEIKIMRLVGASNWFIRTPYIIEGVFYGIIAGGISILMFSPVLFLLVPYLDSFIPGLDMWNYYMANIGGLFGYQLLFGITLGVASSFLAIRRYLNREISFY